MIQIHLEQLQFFGYHGLYPEERLIGGNFIVDITIDHQPNNQIIYTLEETIDYSIVYEMIHQRMKIPTNLLETIATEFCFEIINKFESVQAIRFSIKKLHPPIHQFTGNVGVSFQLKRSEI